ncbi:MAG TPA: HAD-IB family phosphatase [Gemmatimonadaceae bacterium]|nr:HAD-IB family phosphatase [Gemmatimonadaceae bacterium]
MSTLGPPPRFASVVLDVDSTLSGIEGIDWLAARRGDGVSAAVAALTDRAMRGEIALDEVFGTRLAMVRPTRDEVAALTREYEAHAAPGAADAVRALRRAGVRVVVVSGGLREAVAPFAAAMLGVPDGDVHAVRVRFDDGGAYAGYDEASPLATATGKRTLVESLDLPAPALAVGDGATDLAMRPAVSAFAAFTGFASRAPVVAAAEYTVSSFSQLLDLVLR